MESCRILIIDQLFYLGFCTNNKINNLLFMYKISQNKINNIYIKTLNKMNRQIRCLEVNLF
jgi:hypothetical protein